MEVIRTDATGGVLAFWSLAEFSDRETVLQGWGAADLAAFVPEPLPPVTALRDALAAVAAGPRTLVRPLARRTGWAVVREDRGESGNAYTQLARAEVTPGGQVLVVPGVGWDPPLTDKVLAEFAAQQGRVPAARLSAALVDILSSLGGVRIRKHGGLYFLPGDRLPRWREAADVAERAGGGRSRCYVMQQLLTPETVRAVRDAVTAEVEAEAARLSADILSGELGEKALAARTREAAALRGKVLEYERILGVGLEALAATVERAGQAHLAGELLSGLADPTA
jgi:hypothetical protein